MVDSVNEAPSIDKVPSERAEATGSPVLMVGGMEVTVENCSAVR
jgi:hypothetical protein